MVIDDEQGWLPATASQPGGDGTRGLPLLWGEGQPCRTHRGSGEPGCIRSQVHFSSPTGTDVIPTESAVLRFIGIHI
jgi:hypothetical protein